MNFVFRSKYKKSHIEVINYLHAHAFALQGQVSEICDGMDAGLIDFFTICIKGADQKVEGQLLRYNNNFVFIKVKSAIFYSPDRLYKLDFFTNRLPYLVQQSALTFLEGHGIFGILINNPQYCIGASAGYHSMHPSYNR